MAPTIPRPETWEEHERYVAQFARAFLKDPHASRYGVQGDPQHGIDVLAQDRRPEGTGKLWAFQAKHYLSAPLQPQHVRELVPLIEGFPSRDRLHTFVLVTTAKVTAGVKDTAREVGERLQLDFHVWDWEHFSELLRDHCGSGPWLSERERLRLREQYCRQKQEEFQSAGPLYPLISPDFLQSGVFLKDVLLPRRLRLMPELREGKGPEVPRSSGQKDEEKKEGTQSADGGTAPVRYEGELVDWLSPELSSDKPFILMVAPMGAGKSIALFEAEMKLAAAAREQPQAPLPWRFRASELASESLETMVQHSLSPELRRLWADPLSRWIILVDELEGWLNPQGLQRISDLLGFMQVVGVAVGCRDSHLYPHLLPRARRVELPPWSDDERRTFLSLWRKAAPGWKHASAVETILERDPAMSANALCNTLLALQAPESAVLRGGRAALLRTLVDGLCRRWAEARGTRDWKQLQDAFGQAALKGFEQGGGPLPRHVLETALAQVLGDSGIERAIEAAKLEFGLIRSKRDGTWEFPLRAIAEYLAAGALLDRKDAEFIALSGRPWAGEVARLALERCWQFNPERVTALLQRFLQKQPSEGEEQVLRRALVALQVARDLRLGPAAVAQLPQYLLQLLTEERSAWRRRRVGEEVRSLALHGGPLWEALWRELEPVLLTEGGRAAWLAHHEADSPAYWIVRLEEPELAVRVVATEKLARWKHLPSVQEVLLGQLSDEGHNFGFTLEEEPALAAATVLRELPHTEQMRESLLQILQGGSWTAAGAAAVALLPGEAPVEEVMPALQRFFMSGRTFPVVRQAIDAYRALPEGKAWLESYWPKPPAVAAKEPSEVSPRELGNSPTPPVSSLVRRELLWGIAPALRSPELRQKLGAAGFDQRDVTRVVCSIAARVPEAAVELVRGGRRFFPWDAQEALGQAALQHPQLGQALVERWRSRVDGEVPDLFPGFALEPLVARGESEAVKIYAEWLPLCVNAIIPFPRRLSPLLMAQPEVREVARAMALKGWKDANEGKLGFAPFSGLLSALWPGWTEEKELQEGLTFWAREGRLEQINAALRSFMEGELPPEVAHALVERLQRKDAWPREAPFFMDKTLPLWLAAAWRAGVSGQIEPILRTLAEPSPPSPVLYQACLYLMRLNSAEAEDWAQRAASAWPFDWNENRELSRGDVEHLVSSFPEIWARACLDRLGEYGALVEPLFLQMVDQLRNALSPQSPLWSELVAATHLIASAPGAWRSVDFMGPCVRLDDEAQRLLFLMGEPVAPPTEE